MSDQDVALPGTIAIEESDGYNKSQVRRTDTELIVQTTPERRVSTSHCAA